MTKRISRRDALKLGSSVAASVAASPLLGGRAMSMANDAGAQNSVRSFHLDEATIGDVHAAYKSGALTCVKLVQAYLERIRA
jgi:hypothetical protein